MLRNGDRIITIPNAIGPGEEEPPIVSGIVAHAKYLGMDGVAVAIYQGNLRGDGEIKIADFEFRVTSLLFVEVVEEGCQCPVLTPEETAKFDARFEGILAKYEAVAPGPMGEIRARVENCRGIIKRVGQDATPEQWARFLLPGLVRTSRDDFRRALALGTAKFVRAMAREEPDRGSPAFRQAWFIAQLELHGEMLQWLSERGMFAAADASVRVRLDDVGELVIEERVR